MAEGNALGALFASPNISSYSNPTVNALLAGGGQGSDAMDASTSNALKVANQAQQLQSNKVQIDTQTYNLQKAKMDSLHDVYKSIVDNPDPDNATWQLGQAVQAGLVDPQQGATVAGKFASFNGDRSKFQQFALDGMNMNQSHLEALEQAYGTPNLVNVGGSLQSVRTVQGPNAGTYAAGGTAIPITATPALKMGGIETKDPNTGATIFKSNGTLYDDRGNFKGDGSAASIPVYRGAGGTAPAAGLGQGSAPPPAAPSVNAPDPQAPAPAPAQSQAPPPIVGGNKPPPLASGAAFPAKTAASLASSGPSGAALPAAGQGGAPAPQGQGGGAGAPSGASGAMMTPNPQSLPVISADITNAAITAIRNGQNTPANRNILRGYAVQNNLTDQLNHMGPFEAQPAGVGAGVVVPPQGGGQGGGQGAAPVAPAAGGAGGAVPPGRQPPAPVQAPGAPQGGGLGQGGGGGIVTALSPGQEASLKVGADTYGALSSDVTSPNGSNSRIFKIDRALDAIRNTTTGRGTAMRQEMLGTLDALPGGLGRLFPGVDQKDITNYDLATKYTNAIAQSSPGALRSDAGQSLAASANASTNGMTQQAATDVLTNQLGQERMNQAQLRAFNTANLDPGQFPKWSAQWTRNVDPRAFALADMTPGERAAVWGGLKGPARNAFAASVSKAIAGGVYTRADIMGAGGASNGR